MRAREERKKEKRDRALNCIDNKYTKLWQCESNVTECLVRRLRTRDNEKEDTMAVPV